jgi:hypothetical protein
MNLLAKLVQIMGTFTPDQMAFLIKAISDGDRAAVINMLQLSPAEAEIALKGIDSLAVRH